MRRKLPVALLLVAFAGLVLHAEEGPAPLDTPEKKVGYFLGFQLGQTLRDEGASVDADSLARGLRDGLAGVAPVMSEAALQQAMQSFQQQIQANSLKHRAEAAKAFLKKNKTAEGVQTTKSGLQYKVVKKGNGTKPGPADTVTVNYEGTLTNGKTFDSSYQRGQPATFALNQVIPGWTEGLQLMDVGSTYILYVPPELGYGPAPPPGAIGPNAVLIFKVELLDVKPAAAPPK